MRPFVAKLIGRQDADSEGTYVEHRRGEIGQSPVTTGGYQPVMLRRNEPVHDPAMFPQVSQRREVPVTPQRAPQPPADTTFSGVGRDVAHATPHVWQYQALAIPEWLSVMAWPFQIAKVPSALVLGMTGGRQNPLRERTNITSPTPTTLGALTAVDGGQSWSPNLAKITL